MSGAFARTLATAAAAALALALSGCGQPEAGTAASESHSVAAADAMTPTDVGNPRQLSDGSTWTLLSLQPVGKDVIDPAAYDEPGHIGYAATLKVAAGETPVDLSAYGLMVSSSGTGESGSPVHIAGGPTGGIGPLGSTPLPAHQTRTMRLGVVMPLGPVELNFAPTLSTSGTEAGDPAWFHFEP